MKKIAIIKTYPTLISNKYYNSQEIGLAKSLNNLGFEVHIYLPGNSSKITHREYDNIKIIEVPFVRLPIIEQLIFPKLQLELNNHKYHLIHINEQNEFTTYLTSLYAKKNNIPCIIYQGIYKADSSRIKRLYQFLYDHTFSRILKNNISIALTKTTRAKKYIQSKGFDNVEVLPVGLDTTSFNNPTTIDWGDKLNISSNAKVLLYVGILEKRRNIRFLIKIAKALKNKNIFLLIAGEGPEKELFNTKNVYSNIKYLGKVQQKDLKSLYEFSDLFLLASNYEIYGMVVLESLYFGCPVISTKTAGPEDMINDTNGYIINNLNISEWIEAINNSRNKFDRIKISQNLINKLTWPIIAKKYLQLTNIENM